MNVYVFFFLLQVRERVQFALRYIYFISYLCSLFGMMQE